MKRKLLWTMVVILTLLSVSCGSKIPEFSGEQAQRYLQEQCELGARPPGSPEIELCREYIMEKLTEYGADIEQQEFPAEVRGEQIEGVNILAFFHPQLSRRVLLGAHYDTRPWADKDAEKSNHEVAVMGANDGASGVAVLLEIGRQLSLEMPAELGIDMVFFDLEDSGEYENEISWCIGSRYYAQNYKGDKPEKAIIVDMIGEKDLHIPIEYHSYQNAPFLVREIWDIARETGSESFEQRIDKAIVDDHYMLLQEGFNAIVIIDLDYEWWHTVNDTPDKCSSASLKEVGQVLLRFIYQ